MGLGLRSKLALTLAALLLLPIVVVQQLQQIHQYLWTSTEKSLSQQVINLSHALASQPEIQGYLQQVSSVPKASRALLKPLDSYYRLDGAFSEWSSPSSYDFSDDASFFWLAEHQRQLAFAIKVRDAHIVLHHQQRFSKVDYISIYKQEAANAVEAWRLVLTDGGKLQAFNQGEQGWQKDVLLQGAWQQVSGGYQLELAIPQVLINDEFMLAIHNAELKDGQLARNKLWSQKYQFVRTSPDLNNWLAGLQLTDGMQVTLMLDDLILAQQGSTEYQQQRGLINRWLDWLIGQQLSSTKLSVDQLRAQVQEQSPADKPQLAVDRQDKNLLHAAKALQINATSSQATLLVSQNATQLQLDQQELFSNWFSYLLWILLATFVLLALFASHLIIRIRRLSRSLIQSVDSQGKVVNPVAADNSADELGVLASQVAQMVAKLGTQQDYLRLLASRLSHELRTPIAVVRGALENLAYEVADDSQDLLKRAEGGVERLSNLLTRMSEASRIEESIYKSKLETIKLSEVLESYLPIFAESNPEHEIKWYLESDAYVKASPELFIQLLDKLLANALDFSDAKAPINISLLENDGRLTLSVFNSGAHFDAEPESLLQPLVSKRHGQQKSDGNLGLGLYVVKLIADYHNAELELVNVNTETQQGVQILVHLVVV